MAKKKNTIPKLPKNLSHINIVYQNGSEPNEYGDMQSLVLYNDRVDAGNCIIPQVCLGLPSALFVKLTKSAFEEIFEFYDYKNTDKIENVTLSKIIKPEHLSIAYKPMFDNFSDPAAYWCSLYNNTKLTEEEALALADGKTYSPYILPMNKPTFDILFRNKQMVRC